MKQTELGLLCSASNLTSPIFTLSARTNARSLATSALGKADTGGLNGEYHAFSWTQASGMVDLGTLGGTSSSAYAVSNGEVVGYAYTDAVEQSAASRDAVVHPVRRPPS